MNRRRRTRSPYLAVELAHIALIRGGRRVLRGLRWRIRPGQHWLLQGDNGAGKTQLLKLIAGDVWPQPSRAARRVYELRGERSDEPAGVKEHIAYLGAERQDRYEHYAWNHRAATIVGTGIERSDVPLRRLTSAEQGRVGRMLRRLGIDGLARRRFLTLSQGERRLVLLARALVSRPALLLLDEPLNGLDAPNRLRVLAALARLRRSRLPWICATHRAEEAPAGTTHRARLHRGRLRTAAWRAPSAQRARAESRAPVPRRGRGPDRHRLQLELRDASVWREGGAVLRRVSWAIRGGECWVVHGANGSGKSTLLATLYGDHGVASHGSVWRRGHGPGAPLQEFQRRVGRVSPELQAALPRQQTALDCVVAGLRGAFRLDGVPRAGERRAALQALRRVGAARLARRPCGELSYGQARRVLFARALALRPDILLLDEPYTGLDAPTRARLQALVDNLAAMQHAIVIATHHRDEWPRHATHELELVAGRVRYLGPRRSP
ncbi:MAG TPA: ATP-binding cassette domain-containing protein [Steroidobacteraceae bacterium]|nr:ATP-binding cassette domain-containing protein [Steroidobacteraceae bacterium]